MFEVTGKIALTGGGSGIGRATAIVLAKQGARLSIVDVNGAGLKETMELLEGEFAKDATSSVVNVTSGKQVQRWIEHTVAKFGRLDGAANVAGVYIPNALMKSTEKEYDIMFNVNVRGVYHCLQAQVAAMVHGGSIVTVASASGLKGQAQAPIYAATKHAVVGLCTSVAADVGGLGIRVNTVAPGLIETPMTQGLAPKDADSKLVMGSGIPVNRAAKPEEVAANILYLLSDEARFVTGSAYKIDGGYTI